MEVRKVLGIKPKDQVVFTVETDGVRVKPAQSPLLESFQAIPALKSRLSTRKMKESAGEGQAGLAAREGL
ncbi:MAG: AbrB/MazE/SpoVT family DNA-binding domain-containing protein [Armatimonadetes bacterium]|nr:AbrB/MazE/SpoVT family DNA-binding domain-containing protein [Armatimonadota bacterium]